MIDSSDVPKDRKQCRSDGPLHGPEEANATPATGLRANFMLLIKKGIITII